MRVMLRCSGALGLLYAACAGPPHPAPALEPPKPPTTHTTTTAQTRARPPRTIFRQEWEQALARGPGWLLRQLGPPVAERQGSTWRGWRIAARFPDAPQLCGEDCDLQVGDVIESINGQSLATPQAFSAFFEAAPGLSQLSIVRRRHGEREEVTYGIVPAQGQSSTPAVGGISRWPSVPDASPRAEP